MKDAFDTACCTESTQTTTWQRKGDRAMVKGQFTICEYGFKPDVDYGLFGAGPNMIAHDKDFRVLMEIAEGMK